MFLVEGWIAAELDWGQMGNSRGAWTILCPFPQPTTVTLASAKSPANSRHGAVYAQLGSGRNFAASFTSVAKQSASIFRMMCARWI